MLLVIVFTFYTHFKPKTGPGKKRKQAAAFFQWSNYLTHAARAADKIPLYINLDESPMPATMTHVNGNIARTRPGLATPRQRATHGETRQYFTLIASICSDVDIQTKLPQVILVNAHILDLIGYVAVRAHLMDNVYIMRRKSGWTNIQMHVEVIMLLGKILEPYRETHQIIFIIDASKVHLAPECLIAMALNRFWLHIVPASMTWLFQPADVRAFVGLKRLIRIEFHRRMDVANPRKLIVQMLDIVVHAIHYHLQAFPWLQAFEVCGCTGHQNSISRSTWLELSFSEPQTYPRDRPTVVHITGCWPKKLSRPWPLIWACFPPVDVLPAAPAGPPPMPPGDEPFEPSDSDGHDAPGSPPSTPPPDPPRKRLRTKTASHETLYGP